MEFATSYAAVAVASALAVHSYFNFRAKNLRHIPTVGGSSDPLLSFIGARKAEDDVLPLLQEGYARYKGRAFKVPLMSRWHVMLSGPDMVEEIRRFPDDKMSFHEFTVETINMRYTLGGDMADDPYHVDLVAGKLTKSLNNLFPLVLDEVEKSYADEVGNASDWKELSAQKLFMTIVARASNRVFVGVPLCRNDDFLRLAIQYTLDVSNDSRTLNYWPRVLKPIVGRLLTKVEKTTREGAFHLRPIIEERLREMREHGPDYPDRQEDMLQWLLDIAEGPRLEVDALTRRIMTFNFAAIHTSSSTVLHAVYHLAACPEWCEPLRKEVEEVVESDGWTKVAMTKMVKIDSLLRESSRYNAFVGMSMSRLAMEDVTLSTGDFIPKGTFISAPAMSTHWDAEYYDHPEVFDPWRFATARGNEGESAKHQFVNTNAEYINFGHGKHACPGRFFAANELKLMLAHLVLYYDIMLPGGSRVRPENLKVGAGNAPNPFAKICLRARSRD